MQKKHLLSLVLLASLGLAACNQADQNNSNQAESQDQASQQDQVARQVNYYIDPATTRVVPAKEGVDDQVVLATIDDVPRKLPENPTNSVQEARDMINRGIKGIFFVNGMYLEGEHGEEGRKALKEIADMGHVIGNHTMTHYDLSEIPNEEVMRYEIVHNQDVIEETIGYRPKFFRAPFGSQNPALEAILEEENMVAMTWTYGFDWEEAYSEPEPLADIMVNTEMLSPGANILMHDLTWTRDALPSILDGISNKGYGFVDPNEIATREEMKAMGIEP
ncbi:Peptidoglycan/xylan/chitin deacetylase, PgdA/CDA1 family [Aerococcus urinaehominis]|uniref:polysaccharide deacetylase family protein n=1 Tax=Aerococcus urinaehominis TaxID=128944 RepID=UPI00088FEE1B|nr:polysaccharide deacetylase family protein [Aerococcus urinaehominis]SDM59529.1 Peptidoglycan/xylan/chitin deacetylase, PgdA/CDA1 family [Aerococcus urinaehominis]